MSIGGQDGAPDPTRGTDPTGLIHYDTTGHVSAQIVPDRRRPRFSGAQPTPKEAQAALIGYAVYFGTYSVDERARTATHHRGGNINP